MDAKDDAPGRRRGRSSKSQAVVYRNIGDRNVFTEAGRVHPGETIELDPRDVTSDKYPTLEPVE